MTRRDLAPPDCDSGGFDGRFLRQFIFVADIPATRSKPHVADRTVSVPRHVPEKIYVTYNYLPDDRARAQQMFLQAGMLDVVVDPALLSGFQKLPIPNEDTVAQLSLAARLHALPVPTVQTVEPDTTA